MCTSHDAYRRGSRAICSRLSGHMWDVRCRRRKVWFSWRHRGWQQFHPSWERFLYHHVKHRHCLMWRNTYPHLSRHRVPWGAWLRHWSTRDLQWADRRVQAWEWRTGAPFEDVLDCGTMWQQWDTTTVKIRARLERPCRNPQCRFQSPLRQCRRVSCKRAVCPYCTHCCRLVYLDRVQPRFPPVYTGPK